MLDRLQTGAIAAAMSFAGRLRDSGEATMPTPEFRFRFHHAMMALDPSFSGRVTTVINSVITSRLADAYGVDASGCQMLCPTFADALKLQPSFIAPGQSMQSALTEMAIPAAALIPATPTTGPERSVPTGGHTCVFCSRPIWRRYGGTNRVSPAVRLADGHLGEFAFHNDTFRGYAHQQCLLEHTRDPQAILGFGPHRTTVE